MRLTTLLFVFAATLSAAADCIPPQVIAIEVECNKSASTNYRCPAEEPVTLHAASGGYQYDPACDTFIWTRYRNDPARRAEYSTGSASSFTFQPDVVYGSTQAVPWDVTVINAAGRASAAKIVDIAAGTCGPPSGTPEALVAHYRGQKSGCTETSDHPCYRGEQVEFTVELQGEYVGSPCDLLEFQWRTGGLAPDYSPPADPLTRSFPIDGRYEATVNFVPRGFSTGTVVSSSLTTATVSTTLSLDVHGDVPPPQEKRRSVRH